MRCHYDVLNISQSADDSEIKSAYRKLALRWHPDKNLDNSDLAKEQFQLVQQAYEVLSDRQERAWYDKHRDHILHGADAANFTDDSFDVFPYFTSSCFKGYNDDEKGFYTVYRTVFEKIAAEDIEYMEAEGDFENIPKFGDSQSDYDSVVGPFYSYWMGYSTKKSYAWLDVHDLREIRGRLGKYMEKENKKIRLKAKKERNEEIKNLVAFVRKRDKRVQAHAKLMENRALENRKKQEEIRKRKILAREKELSDAIKLQQEWSKFENMQSELKEIEKSLAAEFGEDLSDSDYSESESDHADGGVVEQEIDSLLKNLYCVACNKIFKTSKAFQNHESSKKHRENVEKLKIQVLEEEALNNEIESVKTEEESLSLSDEELHSETPNTKKLKKNKNRKKTLPSTFDASDYNDNFDDHLDSGIGLSKKQKKKNQREQTLAAKDVEKIDENNIEEVNEVLCNENNISSPVNGHQIPSKTPNKKVKRKNKIEDADVNEIDTALCCVVCKSNFSSKNKLFDHLKKTGHSVAIPDKNIKITNGKTKKKNVK